MFVGFFVVFKFFVWFWFGFGLVLVWFCFHFDQCLFAFDRGQGSWSGFLTARHMMYLNLLCYLFCVAPVSASLGFTYADSANDKSNTVLI